jgi:hypothetical protein
VTDDVDFFIGWDDHPPRRLARFLLGVALFAACVMLLLGLALGRAVDAGAGEIVGETTVAGILEMTPYPHLRSPPDAVHPNGHAVLLAGDGKYGIASAAVKFAGHAVEARGALVKRGDLDMLIVSPDDGVRPTVILVSNMPAIASLGRWRISGEICDGKCNAGIMRPGAGIAHKACATLCVSGGVPPVFVTTSPVEGAGFMLLADGEGAAAPARMLDFMAIPVTLEGVVERRGDLAVFRVDWSSARVR